MQYNDRKQTLNNKEEKFVEEYIIDLNDKFNDILLIAIDENKTKNKTHYNSKKTLINRILEYKNDHFMQMHDFTLPYDDNLSEKTLRAQNQK